MPRQSFFKSGRHVAAARTMAGLKQTELAELAGLHVNSVKRLEAMGSVLGSEHACNLIGQVLLAKGIISETLPMASIRLVK
ncbi:MAG: helix-turn-helix domain-containing protein [Alphaproteobacteria bacterium]|nr:helix-turn-helix domain-containing protein [Alphaproteobacteria bacterium]